MGGKDAVRVCNRVERVKLVMGSSGAKREEPGTGISGRHTVRSQWGDFDSGRAILEEQLGSGGKQKSKKKRDCGLPNRVSACSTSETQPMEWLVQNVASPRPGIGG